MPGPLTPMHNQWFPQYYSLGPRNFLDGNADPSGAAGSVASLSKDVPNFPILFMGLRIRNVYQLPQNPTELDLRIYALTKKYTDAEQTVRITLSQQNITADAPLQDHVCGLDGVYWAPFPIPYPMAGGNNAEFVITRLTNYPQLNQENIIPVVHLTMVTIQARDQAQTMPPMRVDPYNPHRLPS